MPREYAPADRKRKSHDISDDADAAAATAPGGGPRKRIQLPKKEHKYPSVNELKKRIRDVKRLLNKTDLPADARIVQERALSGYEKELEDELKRRDRSKMIKKYHFVRFLDRKTATKDVNRLVRREKEVSSAGPDAMDEKTKEKKLASLAGKLRVARVNLNYTIYYPLDEKYIALYAEQKKKVKGEGAEDGGDGADSDGDARFGMVHATVADKPAMWHVVEKCMKDGTLDMLRDGKLESGAKAGEKDRKKEERSQRGGEKAKKSQERGLSSSQAGKSKDRSRKVDDRKRTRGSAAEDHVMRDAGNDDGEESDGGFFEM
ncbi:rRNA-processing protein efg1 [Aspergillus tubingensis]